MIEALAANPEAGTSNFHCLFYHLHSGDNHKMLGCAPSKVKPDRRGAAPNF
jgi:hypothetical protein